MGAAERYLCRFCSTSDIVINNRKAITMEELASFHCLMIENTLWFSPFAVSSLCSCSDTFPGIVVRDYFHLMWKTQDACIVVLPHKCRGNWPLIPVIKCPERSPSTGFFDKFAMFPHNSQLHHVNTLGHGAYMRERFQMISKTVNNQPGKYL